MRPYQSPTMEIQTLQLACADLEAMKAFYSETLEISVLEASADSFSVKIGQSTLRFKQAKNPTPYHFAFNIPSEQIEQAYNWLNPRVAIELTDGSPVANFESWNAKAIYFYDPDKNIVEFIARKNLNIPGERTFGPASLISISEIGVSQTSIESFYNQVKQELGLSKYSGNFDSFCAIGTETGLFIVVNPKNKNWYPNGDPIHASPFEAEVQSPKGTAIIRYNANQLTIQNTH